MLRVTRKVLISSHLEQYSKVATWQKWLSKRGAELEPTLPEISSECSERWECWLLLLAPPAGVLHPAHRKALRDGAVCLGLGALLTAAGLSTQGAHPMEQSQCHMSELLYQSRAF